MALSLAFIFGILGNIISFMVFLAPIPAYRQIYRKKSSEGFQSLPYVVALFSAMLWIYYAILKPGNTLLFTINSVGCIIETFYVGFHLFYASKTSRILTTKLVVGMIVCGMGFIVLGTEFLVKPINRDNVVGWICLIFSLCVFVAPLAIVRKVIRTKSVEYMPFLLSFFLTLSSVMWFFYGLLKKDFVIAIPNVLGFGFGILQMLLYFIYKNAGKKAEEKNKLPETDIRLPEIVVQKKNTGNDQVIDMAKLGGVRSENIPAVNSPANYGIERQNAVAIEARA